MSSYQYNITGNYGVVPDSTSGVLPGVHGAFDPIWPLPVDDQTYARRLNDGDIVTFNVATNWSAYTITMNIAVSPDSNNTGIFPFSGGSTTNGIWSTSISTSGTSTALTVVVNKDNQGQPLLGKWKMWFTLATSANPTAIVYYIADPEVQTQTGGNIPQY